MSIEYLLRAVALLLVLSVLGGKASGRVGVPALLLFLLPRMLAGSDGRGGIEFDDPWLAQSLRVNNPMAIFLTIRFTRLIVELEAQLIDPMPMFFRQMAIGTAGDYGMGWGRGVGVNAVRLEYDGPGVEPRLGDHWPILSMTARTDRSPS